MNVERLSDVVDTTYVVDVPIEPEPLPYTIVVPHPSLIDKDWVPRRARRAGARSARAERRKRLGRLRREQRAIERTIPTHSPAYMRAVTRGEVPA